MFTCRKNCSFLLTLMLFAVSINAASAQKVKPVLRYIVSIPDPSSHYYVVALNCTGWVTDTIDFKMPEWMPGYYQIMNYANEVADFSVKDSKSKTLAFKKMDSHTWRIANPAHSAFQVSYKVKADKQFVANSYLDSAHAYISPCALFLYIDGYLHTPVAVKLMLPKNWHNMATGLSPVAGKANEFTAPDFDVLYDCPILAGNLEELPSFKIKGIEHRFVGYRLGSFDKVQFMANLKKVVEAGINIIGDVPYNRYTFIAIGPGGGGIEHLNNTTVSFDGNRLNTDRGMHRTLNFLAHEYFHHYNVKRIRPFELGPFDYEKGNKTNLLWVSEGLSVYYEYLIVARAGLIAEQGLFGDFENSINAFENNPGRMYQSLSQASYATWSDGPSGKQAADTNKSISYYDKGPAVGLLLDLSIRHATGNTKSLDDVMRLLYYQYYKKLQRGFTDAEFQQACESIAGVSLSEVFEYIYTTKELDYNAYLIYAGLKMEIVTDPQTGKRNFTLHRLEKMDAAQTALVQSWEGK